MKRGGDVLCILAAVVVSLGVVALGCGGGTAATTTASIDSTTSTEKVSPSYTTATNPFASLNTTSSTSAGPTAGGSTSTVPQSSTTTTESTGGSSTSTSTGASTSTTHAQTTTTHAPTTESTATSTTARGEIVLRVTGPSGERSFSMAELKQVAATEGYGGFKNKLGNITAPALWKGVTLASLFDLVGGVSAGSQVQAVASDGYALDFTYAQVAQGDFVTFDPATGEENQPSGQLELIIAYACNGSALTTDEGPLRLALVSPQADQVTTSSYWVKSVDRLIVQ